MSEIKTVTDGSGAHYLVTVRTYSYATHDRGQVSAWHDSGVDVLQSVADYPTVEIDAPDTAGLRYSYQPAADAWTTFTTLDASDDLADAARGQIVSVSQRLDDMSATSRLKTTTYAQYLIVDSMRQTAKPKLVTVQIQRS